MAAVVSELLYLKQKQQGWSHQEKKKTLFWLWPCSAKEGGKKSPFLSAGTEPHWDTQLHLLYHLPALLSQGWESWNTMRNFTPPSAGPRTRTADLSEERRAPRGSQRPSISAALLEKLCSPHNHGRGYWSTAPRAAQTREGQTEDGLPDAQTAPFIPHRQVLLAICPAVRPRRRRLIPGASTGKHKYPQAEQNWVNLRPQQVSTFYITWGFITWSKLYYQQSNLFCIHLSLRVVQEPNTTGVWQNVPAMSPWSTLSLYCWANLIQALLHSKQSLKHLFVRYFQSIFILRCSPVLHLHRDILQDSQYSLLSTPYRQEAS